jgi:hypothetical protein
MLHEIAAEHNVEWNPKEIEAINLITEAPPENLLVRVSS